MRRFNWTLRAALGGSSFLPFTVTLRQVNPALSSKVGRLRHHPARMRASIGLRWAVRS